MLSAKAVAAAALLASSTPAFAAYNLVKEYSGTSFFSGWDFYGSYDNLTNGACLIDECMAEEYGIAGEADARA